MAYIRDVQGWKPGVRLVQIVWSKHQGRREVEYVGTAHDQIELAALRQAGQDRIHENQTAFDFGLQTAFDFGLEDGRPQTFTIVSSHSARLWETLLEAYRRLGFDQVVSDSLFRKLVLARIVEPTSKRDALRVLEDLGVKAPSYAAVKKMLTRCYERGYRQMIQQACCHFSNIEELTLCLYDVTTLYWETDTADGLRQPGYSKERRLEPQLTVGLLTTVDGFPLVIQEFEGNRAETRTLLPVLGQFQLMCPSAKITIVADAGMLSHTNLAALEQAGYQFIIGGRVATRRTGRVPALPIAVTNWLGEHPGQSFSDGQILGGPTRVSTRVGHWVEWVQFRQARANRDLRGIEQSIKKAQAIVDGKASTKRNRFVISERDRGLRLDQALIDSARARAGLRSYQTNLDADPQFIIDTYHQLWQIEHSFRMAKSDLRARPAYHWNQDRIQAHLTIVFTALALSKWIEATTGITIREFIHQLRPIRQVTIAIADTTITAEPPIPSTALQALQNILGSRGH